MQLRFSKMHGLGNDFVVIDGINQQVSLDAAKVRFMADRHFGIGCDQLLLVETATDGASDFRYRIFNADGGEVGQCGNGARCFARFVRDRGLTDKNDFTVQTSTGRMQLMIEPDGLITVSMGVPRLEPKEIPFVAGIRADDYTLQVKGQVVHIGAVSLGNPHAVIKVENIDTAPVEILGPLVESHSRFPERVNVGFMEVRDRNHIRLRVYERGVGETLACGSGACAAAVVGRIQGMLDERVHVELPGGSLRIRWAGGGEPVWMTGPATHVYEGNIEL